MKLVLVILAGAADHPLPALGDRSPLAAARMPFLGEVLKKGRTGGVRTVPRKMAPSFEVALQSLFGEDPARASVAPGGLLASALGFRCSPRDVCFRCDFVNLFEGAIVDPTAGRIEGKQAEILVEFLESELGTDGVRFVPGDRWRNLLVFGQGRGERARTSGPASFLGEQVTANDASGPDAEEIRSLEARAAELLPDHEINTVRVDLKENPANGIWIWGGGRPGGRGAGSPTIPGGGRAVGAHPSFLGLAREAGLTPVVIRPGADPLAEPARLAAGALSALDETDFVAVALEGALLASRLGDVDGKVAVLQAADRDLVRPLAERVSSEDGRILVVASHAVSVERRRDLPGVVPFVLMGEGTARYGEVPFTEEAAENAELVVEKGHELIEYARRA